jgi:hypothetical protein
VVKAVTIFLVVIVVLAMFGKLGWLGALAPKRLRKPGQNARVCKSCGRHLIGTSPCATLGCHGGTKSNPKGQNPKG